MSAEMRSQLYMALDVGYVTHSEFEPLLTQAEEVGRIIGGLRLAVVKQRDQERKKRL
jgi:four helix bundle protein